MPDLHNYLFQRIRLLVKLEVEDWVEMINSTLVDKKCHQIKLNIFLNDFFEKKINRKFLKKVLK